MNVEKRKTANTNFQVISYYNMNHIDVTQQKFLNKSLVIVALRLVKRLVKRLNFTSKLYLWPIEEV